MACKRCGYNGAGVCPVCWPGAQGVTTHEPLAGIADDDNPQYVPTEVSPQCACGKPRDGRHSSCAACRKRAYRERSK
ncbi:hypothetical protein LCGC14_0792960 [marine sediment metagenome]|uniref:Uncharacterized protein n=1 Tax=marine sediment metagenome TaxID=412755 RepID=A0A0F9SBX0_9ZZZZ